MHCLVLKRIKQDVGTRQYDSGELMLGSTHLVIHLTFKLTNMAYSPGEEAEPTVFHTLVRVSLDWLFESSSPYTKPQSSFHRSFSPGKGQPAWRCRAYELYMELMSYIKGTLQGAIHILWFHF